MSTSQPTGPTGSNPIRDHNLEKPHILKDKNISELEKCREDVQNFIAREKDCFKFETQTQKTLVRQSIQIMESRLLEKEHIIIRINAFIKDMFFDSEMVEAIEKMPVKSPSERQEFRQGVSQQPQSAENPQPPAPVVSEKPKSDETTTSEKNPLLEADLSKVLTTEEQEQWLQKLSEENLTKLMNTSIENRAYPVATILIHQELVSRKKPKEEQKKTTLPQPPQQAVNTSYVPSASLQPASTPPPVASGVKEGQLSSERSIRTLPDKLLKEIVDSKIQKFSNGNEIPYSDWTRARDVWKTIQNERTSQETEPKSVTLKKVEEPKQAIPAPSMQTPTKTNWIGDPIDEGKTSNFNTIKRIIRLLPGLYDENIIKVMKAFSTFPAEVQNGIVSGEIPIGADLDTIRPTMLEKAKLAAKYGEDLLARSKEVKSGNIPKSELTGLTKEASAFFDQF